MKTIDFYSGYEGEPEYLIKSKIQDKDHKALRIWSGYFDAIINEVQPEKNGNWQGVTLCYHLLTGWFDEPWECEDKLLFLDQLNRIDQEKLSNETVQVLKAIKNFIEISSTSNHSVYIEYD